MLFSSSSSKIFFMIDEETPPGAVSEDAVKPEVKSDQTGTSGSEVKIEDGKNDPNSPFLTNLPEGIEVTKVSVPVKPVTFDEVQAELENVGGKLKRAGWRTSETTGVKPASQGSENAGATIPTPPATPLKK